MRKIVPTGDGSHTVALPEQNLTYHSVHGAVQESVHVFLEAGLEYVLAQKAHCTSLRIFEMGFGTGLNAFLTAIRAARKKLAVHYTAVETSPLSTGEALQLNYAPLLGHAGLFEQLHAAAWDEAVSISEGFVLEKQRTDLALFSAGQSFDLVYFDAFAPAAQPELWTVDIFRKMFSLLLPGGVLVTYCAKGDVRRAMAAAGFSVQKIPGPPGKREMLRATKPVHVPEQMSDE